MTPELLRLFIQRIEVGERGKKHLHSSGQSIRIVYRDIGATDSAMDAAEQQPRITAAITDSEDVGIKSKEADNFRRPPPCPNNAIATNSTYEHHQKGKLFYTRT